MVSSTRDDHGGPNSGLELGFPDGDETTGGDGGSARKGTDKPKGTHVEIVPKEGRKSDGSGVRAKFSGSPDYLQQRLADEKERKRAKRKAQQKDRKRTYGAERRSTRINSVESTGSRTERFMEVNVKLEKLEKLKSEPVSTSSLAKAIDLTTEGEEVVEKMEVSEVIEIKEDVEMGKTVLSEGVVKKKELTMKKEMSKKSGDNPDGGPSVPVTGKKKTRKKKGIATRDSTAAKAISNLIGNIGRVSSAPAKDAGKKVIGPKANEKDDPLKMNMSATKPPPVVNHYAGFRAKAKERTVKTKQLVMGTRTKYKGLRRFRVTFVSSVKRNYQGAEGVLKLQQQAADLRNALVNILKRAQATCKRASIHPWVGEDDTEMPTLRDARDIPRTYGELRRYLTHDDDQFKVQGVQPGSNPRWRVYLNYDMTDHAEFLHLYQNSKTEWSEYPYVQLMDAPLQDRHYHCLGFLVDSSPDQPTEVNERGVSEIMNFEVGISFGNLPMGKDYLNGKWEEARAKAQGKRDTFLRSPQSLGVFVEEKSLQTRATMAKKMAARFGQMTDDGMYEVWPDGTRMRFLPNEKLVPFNKKKALEAFADLQVLLKSAAMTLDIGIADPNFIPEGEGVEEKTGGKSMGQLILGLTAGESDLPIFRHFTKRYSRKYNPRAWSVSVHPNMQETAVETLRDLKEILGEKYGETVASNVFKEHNSYASKAGIQNSNFKPDDTGFDFLDVSKDWYLSGSAKCLIEGMENMVESPSVKKAWDDAIRSVDDSKMTFLSGLNTANEERTTGTLAAGSVGFSETASCLSYNSRLSSKDSNAGGSVTTVALDSPVSSDSEGSLRRSILKANVRMLPPKSQQGKIWTSPSRKKAGDMELDDLAVTPSPLIPREIANLDVVMDDGGKDDGADGVGGSEPHAVSGGQWTRQGSRKDEETLRSSLFQRSFQLAKDSAVTAFSSAVAPKSSDTSPVMGEYRHGGRGRGGGRGGPGRGRGSGRSPGRGLGPATWPGQPGRSLFEETQRP